MLNSHANINFDLVDVIEILIAFVFAYIFEYGYELQEESKAKIYGKAEKEKSK